MGFRKNKVIFIKVSLKNDFLYVLLDSTQEPTETRLIDSKSLLPHVDWFFFLLA